MKLNWFSPLPPADSGPARYTAAVLPTLCDHAEVTLWTDQADAEPADARATLLHCPAAQVPWEALNRADLNVYVLAGDCGAAWEVSRRHPGLVVLHGAVELAAENALAVVTPPGPAAESVGGDVPLVVLPLPWPGTRGGGAEEVAQSHVETLLGLAHYLQSRRGGPLGRLLAGEVATALRGWGAGPGLHRLTQEAAREIYRMTAPGEVLPARTEVETRPGKRGA